MKRFITQTILIVAVALLYVAYAHLGDSGWRYVPLGFASWIMILLVENVIDNDRPL